MICKECYSELNRIIPLNDATKCLSEHTQYICSICGRCICFEKDSKRNVMRWNFPFTTLDTAKLYLRAADYYCKENCVIEYQNTEVRKLNVNELKRYFD